MKIYSASVILVFRNNPLILGILSSLRLLPLSVCVDVWFLRRWDHLLSLFLQSALLFHLIDYMVGFFFFSHNRLKCKIISIASREIKTQNDDDFHSAACLPPLPDGSFDSPRPDPITPERQITAAPPQEWLL